MSSREPSPPDPTAERVNELSRSFWNSAILRAGIKLGIFSLLEHRELSAKDVASRIGASPRFVQAFLDACVVLDLLKKTQSKYLNAPLASKFLVKGKREYVGDLALHITNHWESWGRLDQLIKEGRAQLPFQTGYVDDATYWNDYIMGQHNRAEAGQAHYLVQHVDLRGRRKMLDLGGGAASYSIALCEANPLLASVVVDRREPLEIAKSLVAEHGLGDRISLMEGDFHVADLGTGYDVVLISGVVVIQSEAACRHLFRRGYEVMVPGGLLIIQDFLRVDKSPQRRLLDTLMDMYVLIAFDPGAGDRRGEEVGSWLQDAGFRNPKMVPFPTHLALITAER